MQNQETDGLVDRQMLRSICDTFKQLRGLAPTLPVGAVYMFLQVALNEGASLSELTERSGIKKATASRYLLDLSDKVRSGDSGYGLVLRSADPQELRRNQYSLSPLGRTIIKQLAAYRNQPSVRANDNLTGQKAG